VWQAPDQPLLCLLCASAGLPAHLYCRRSCQFFFADRAQGHQRGQDSEEAASSATLLNTTVAASAAPHRCTPSVAEPL
jgi:hypothetical protein